MNQAFLQQTILVVTLLAISTDSVMSKCSSFYVSSDHYVENDHIIISSASLVKITVESDTSLQLTKNRKPIYEDQLKPRHSQFTVELYLEASDYELVDETIACAISITVLSKLDLFSYHENEATLIYETNGSFASVYFTTSQESRSFNAFGDKMAEVGDIFAVTFNFTYKENFDLHVNFEIDGFNQSKSVSVNATEDPIYAIQLRKSEGFDVTLKGHIITNNSTQDVTSFKCIMKPYPGNEFWQNSHIITFGKVGRTYDGRIYAEFEENFQLSQKSSRSIVLFYKVACNGSRKEGIGYIKSNSDFQRVPINSVNSTTDGEKNDCVDMLIDGNFDSNRHCELIKNGTYITATFDLGFTYPLSNVLTFENETNNRPWKLSFYDSSLSDEPFKMTKSGTYSMQPFYVHHDTIYKNVRFVMVEKQYPATLSEIMFASDPVLLRRNDKSTTNSWQETVTLNHEDGYQKIINPMLKVQDMIVETTQLGMPDQIHNTTDFSLQYHITGEISFAMKEHNLVTNEFDIVHEQKSIWAMDVSKAVVPLVEEPVKANNDSLYTFVFQVITGVNHAIRLRVGSSKILYWATIKIISDLAVMVVLLPGQRLEVDQPLTVCNYDRRGMKYYEFAVVVPTLAPALTDAPPVHSTQQPRTLGVPANATNIPNTQSMVCDLSAKWCFLRLIANVKNVSVCNLTCEDTSLIRKIDCNNNAFDCSGGFISVYLEVEIPNDVNTFKLQCSGGGESFEKTLAVRLTALSKIQADVMMVIPQSPNISISFVQLENIDYSYSIINDFNEFGKIEHTIVTDLVCEDTRKCSFPQHIYSKLIGRQELCLIFLNSESVSRFCKTLILPNLTVKSSKLQYAKSENFLIDSLYKVSLSITFPNIPQEVISYNWEDATGTHTDIFKCENSCMKTFSGSNSTHVVTVNASGVTMFPVSVSSKFVLYEGINVTFHVNKAQQLNTTSAFKINIWSLGFNPCLFLNVDDPTFIKQYGFYDETDVGAQSRCLSKAPSTLNIIWHAIPISSQISRNVTIHHTYQKEGVYNATFVAVNIVHDQNITIPINVLSVQCETPEVTLEGLGISDQLPVTYFQSEGFIVESFSKVNCNESAVTTTLWNIYHGEGLQEEFVSSRIIIMNVVNFKVEPRSLPYGMYRICVVLSMSVSENFQSEKCGYLLITYSPLFASLAGGIEVRRAAEYEYNIDASLSMDPDTGNAEGVIFYYLCRSKEDPEYNVSRENIQDIPFVLSNIQDTDSGGCFGTGPGRLVADNTAMKLTIAPGRFVIDEKLEVTLFLWKGTPVEAPRSAIIKQRLTMLSGNPPSVSISCLANCGTHISRSKAHSFEGTCDDKVACAGKLTFLWLLFTCSDRNADNCIEVDSEVVKTIRSTKPSSTYYSTIVNGYNASQWYKLVFRSYRGEVYGEAAAVFFINVPPKDGQCSVDKYSGRVYSDEFQIKCDNWKDDELPLKYKFFTIEKGVQQSFYAGMLPEYFGFLPIGNKNKNYSLPIYMSISDKFGSEVVVNTSVQVLPPLDVGNLLDSLLLSSQDNESDINVYAKSGDIEKLTNTIVLFASILNDVDDGPQNNTNMTEAEKQKKLDESVNAMKLRESFVSNLKSVKLSDAGDAVKLLGTFSAVTSKPSELSPKAQDEIINKCDEVVDLLDSVNTEDKLELAKGVYNTMSKVMEISSSVADVNNPNNSKNDAVLHVCPDKEKCKKESVANVNKTKSSLKKLNGMFLKSVIPSADPMVFEGDTIGFAMGKFVPSSDSTKIGTKGSTVAIPNLSGLIGDNTKDSVDKEKDFVSIEVVSYDDNIFSFDESAANVKSKITGIDLSSKDGTPIEVNSELEVSVVNKPVKKNISENQAQIKPNGEQWAFHTVAIRNTSFRSKIKTENDSHLITYVYLRKEKRPTEDIYDYKWKLPDNSSCRWLNETLHAGEDIVIGSSDKSQYYCTRDDNAVFVSDEDELYGTYYLGIQYIPLKKDVSANTVQKQRRRRRRSNEKIDVSKVSSEFCVAVLPPPPTPPPTDPPGSWVVMPPTVSNDSVKYTVDITTAKCLFWNETEQQWGSNGCRVGPDTTPEVTQCLCNHLTDFGGDVLVAPNPIDFDKVFEGLANLADNLGVLMVILSIVLVYVLLVVWARKKDRKDEEEQGPIVIDCSGRSQNAHSYLVTIVTGAGIGAGTSAKVYLRISGSIGDSKIIPLTSDVRNMFQARSTTSVKVILPQSIGDLDYIRIFHDNSGKSPSWYLRNVVVTDLTSKKQYPFVYDSWLAVESDDGQIEAMLSVASNKELAGFHIVFASTAAKSLLDGHIWFSIFTRPKQSTFTRVQRLSCCLCLIFLTMITNAMFFGAGDAGPKTTIRLGNVVIDITGIIIGIEASLIVIPPSVLVIEIFRRLKPKQVKQQKQKAKQSPKDPLKDVNDLKDYGESLRDNILIDKQKKKKNDKGSFLFPHGFKYLAYVVIGLSSSGSALFTFFYSMMWGPEKSNAWLSSMFSGFFQSILIIQPVKAVLMAILFALILRKPIKDEPVHNLPTKGIKKKEEISEDLDGDDDLITADEIPIIRPTESALERARKEKLKEKMTGQIIRDIATYAVFLVVVVFLAYSEKDPNTFYLRQDMENMFLNGRYSRGPSLELVNNPGYFYSWLRDTFVPSVFVGPWYNDDLPKSYSFVDNRASLLLSIPRLRQQRVQKDSCIISSQVMNVVDKCFDAYSFDEEDEETYEAGWESVNITKRSRRDTGWIVFEGSLIKVSKKRVRRYTSSKYVAMKIGKGNTLRRRTSLKGAGSSLYYVTPAALHPDGTVISCGDRWKHFTAKELRGFPFWGKLGTYSGGGYIANLGYNEETAWTVMADLHAHNWLDRQTRAVFVEFTVYNANVNLFATAFLFMEILPTGGGFPQSDFKVFNGYRYALNSHISNRILEAAFLFFVIYFAAKEIKKLLKQRLTYFKGFFNMIEVLLFPLNITMFGLIIFRWLSTAKNIRQFKENPKDYVSFQYSAEADAALQAVIGVIVFLLNIKFLKYFQFSKSFYQVGLIMKSFFKPLLGFCVSFSIYFIMFAAAAHLGFGARSENYQTFMRTIITQFLHLLGATDFEEAKNASVFFGPIYYVSYSLLVMFITFNVFIAIICGAIDEDYEEEFEKNLGDVHVIRYLMSTFKSLFGFENQEKGDDFCNTHPKCDEMDSKMTLLEDSVELLLSRFKAFEIEYPQSRNYIQSTSYTNKITTTKSNNANKLTYSMIEDESVKSKKHVKGDSNNEVKRTTTISKTEKKRVKSEKRGKVGDTESVIQLSVNTLNNLSVKSKNDDAVDNEVNKKKQSKVHAGRSSKNEVTKVKSNKVSKVDSNNEAIDPSDNAKKLIAGRIEKKRTTLKIEEKKVVDTESAVQLPLNSAINVAVAKSKWKKVKSKKSKKHVIVDDQKNERKQPTDDAIDTKIKEKRVVDIESAVQLPLDSAIKVAVAKSKWKKVKSKKSKKHVIVDDQKNERKQPTDDAIDTKIEEKRVVDTVSAVQLPLTNTNELTTAKSDGKSVKSKKSKKRVKVDSNDEAKRPTTDANKPGTSKIEKKVKPKKHSKADSTENVVPSNDAKGLRVKSKKTVKADDAISESKRPTNNADKPSTSKMEEKRVKSKKHPEVDDTESVVLLPTKNAKKATTSDIAEMRVESLSTLSEY